jgi:N4-(beta-N-acetylglucosaminyl)-L-asparaginase
MRTTRRTFLKNTAGAGALLAAAPVACAQVKAAPAVHAGGGKPVVISSKNGHQYKNGGPRTCVEEAFLRITRGADVLEALVAGVNILELDPEETGVGYGGLPNANGIVQLDASCMHGPRGGAGAVACLEGVRTPSLVAKAVMDQTDHHLLVGRDAQAFARQVGFGIEADLNTDKSRKLWLEWKRSIDPGHWLDPQKRRGAADGALRRMIADGRIEADHAFGTIHCSGLNARGDVCGVTTTSGLPFKIPGRVGDSPILGAGLYVDGDVGAAGSTGRGEANLYGLSSYLIVEQMRAGAHPKDAGMEALRRVVQHTREKRLLKEPGRPNFNLSFYVVDRRGRFAGVSLYATEYAVCDESGPRTFPTEALLSGKP